MENEIEEVIEQVDSANYKCPECGAPMRYDPATMSLKCDYCGRVIQLKENSSTEELNYNEALNTDNSWQRETHIIRCENCGAENIVSKKEISLKCPFCSSTQVVESSSIAGIKPGRVIPFKIDSKQALESYRNLIKRKFFVPRYIKKMNLELTLNGVYIPVWTYDTNTFSSYKGKLGKHYTTTVGSGKNRRTVTKTRYFYISGTKIVDFDDVLVNAGNSISQSDLNKLKPFNTNESSTFDESFLAGFSTEHYSKDLKNGFDDAKATMQPIIKNYILKQYTYDVVSYINISTHYDNIKYKYVLIPVWFGLFKHKNKLYRFLVNGENGKISAKYPKSVWKILFVIGLCIAVFIAFLLLVKYYG